MTKTYYAITKQSKENFPLYLTAKFIKGQNIAMFTGNKDFAYTFESIQDANNFFLNYPWSEVPEIEIKPL